jgi:hypothetical protein
VLRRTYLEKRANLETDDGAVLIEKGLRRELLPDWDLEVDERRRHGERGIAQGRKPLKLVRNLVFSMPKGNAADKLHKAVQKFATEKFGAQAPVCHGAPYGSGPPPRARGVKAMSERGERPNIYKPTRLQ